MTNTEVVGVDGGEYPNKIIYKNNKTGKETTFASKDDTFGVFVFVGYEPASELVVNAVATDKYGYILTLSLIHIWVNRVHIGKMTRTTRCLPVSRVSRSEIRPNLTNI